MKKITTLLFLIVFFYSCQNQTQQSGDQPRNNAPAQDSVAAAPANQADTAAVKEHGEENEKDED